MDEHSFDHPADRVETRLEFTAYIQTLLAELQTDPQSWENNNLESYLEALAAYVTDMHGGYANQGLIMPEQPTWNMLAGILTAATIYE